MKIDWITVRVIWRIFSGFVMAVLMIALLAGVASVVFADNSPLLTKDINTEYYFTQQTCGFPNLDTIEEIRVYKKKEWLPDEKIASIDLYAYQVKLVELAIQENRFKMYVNGTIKLDTLINAGELLQMQLDDW